MKTREQLENELKLLESGADAIREQLAAMPKQWEPEGGEFSINKLDGCVFKSITSPEWRSAGLERKTIEAAERAAIEMRKFNRLLAWCDEHYPHSSVHVETYPSAGRVSVSILIGATGCLILDEKIVGGEVVL